MHRAVERARAVGGDCVQLFTGNPRSFPVGQANADPGALSTKKSKAGACPSIADEDAARFRATLIDLKIAHPIAHDSYLINLASPDDLLWRRSIEAFVIELRRAEQLGIEYVVTHPGASLETSQRQGLARIARALDEVHDQTRGLRVRALLETTAGQGSSLGWRFEHLADILAGVRDPERLGVCVDTCHIFAAGYPLGTLRDYRATMNRLAAVVGLDRVKAIHLNDSKRELGSRVDRHEHIGAGRLGLRPFQYLLNDPRFSHVPMYLETPKGMKDGKDLDVMNLTTLRGLVEE